MSRCRSSAKGSTLCLKSDLGVQNSRTPHPAEVASFQVYFQKKIGRPAVFGPFARYWPHGFSFTTKFSTKTKSGNMEIENVHFRLPETVLNFQTTYPCSENSLRCVQNGWYNLKCTFPISMFTLFVFVENLVVNENPWGQYLANGPKTAGRPIFFWK